jgi:hypothetical protein
MQDLFSDLRIEAAPAISGLSYVLEYITEQEEAELVAAIDAAPWDETWDRRRQPYGATYGPRKGERRPVPEWGLHLVERLHADGVGERRFDQMLVNEYTPGQGISFHRDYEPFDRTVVSLSLLAPCVMDFRHATDGRRATMLLEPRSLLVLSDEARYEWEHGIARRKSDRWNGVATPRRRRLSVTFRKLRD